MMGQPFYFGYYLTGRLDNSIGTLKIINKTFSVMRAFVEAFSIKGGLQTL